MSDDIKRTAKIIVEARNAFSRQFHGVSSTCCCIQILLRLQEEELIPYLGAAKVKYLDYSELFDPDPSQGLRIEDDPHPTPKAYRLVAEKLTRDLGIREVAGQN